MQQQYINEISPTSCQQKQQEILINQDSLEQGTNSITNDSQYLNEQEQDKGNFTQIISDDGQLQLNRPIDQQQYYYGEETCYLVSQNEYDNSINSFFSENESQQQDLLRSSNKLDQSNIETISYQNIQLQNFYLSNTEIYQFKDQIQPHSVDQTINVPQLLHIQNCEEENNEKKFQVNQLNDNFTQNIQDQNNYSLTQFQNQDEQTSQFQYDPQQNDQQFYLTQQPQLHQQYQNQQQQQQHTFQQDYYQQNNNENNLMTTNLQFLQQYNQSKIQNTQQINENINFEQNQFSRDYQNNNEINENNTYSKQRISNQNTYYQTLDYNQQQYPQNNQQFYQVLQPQQLYNQQQDPNILQNNNYLNEQFDQQNNDQSNILEYKYQILSNEQKQQEILSLQLHKQYDNNQELIMFADKKKIIKKRNKNKKQQFQYKTSLYS